MGREASARSQVQRKHGFSQLKWTLSVAIFGGFPAFVTLLFFYDTKLWHSILESFQGMQAQRVALDMAKNHIEGLGAVDPKVAGYIQNLQKEVFDNKDKVAICVTGQAREFHLTGLSQKKNVFHGWENVDVFLNMVLDEDIYKIALLAGIPNIVSVHIAPHVSVNQSFYPEDVIDAQWSGGVQGILEQLAITENCIRLIKEQEIRSGIYYRWVMRMRADSFWFTRPPPLDSLDRSRYTVPAGNHYAGYNDRLGVGDRQKSWLAMDRLRQLQGLKKKGVRGLNAEMAYKRHMEMMGVSVGYQDFSFCILSHKKMRWGDVPVFSMDTQGALNGAKCRPCKPRAVGVEAVKILDEFKEGNPKWVGATVHDAEICDASKPWEAGWERIYDEQTGKEYADMRLKMEAITFTECVESLRQIASTAKAWESPTPEAMCERRYLGKAQLLGAGEGSYPTLMEPLNANSTVYSVGIGYDVSWEKAYLDAMPGAQVFAFDGSPTSVDMPNAEEPNKTASLSLPAGVQLRRWIFAKKHGKVRLRSIGSKHFSTYTLADEEIRKGYVVQWGKQKYNGLTLRDIMKRMKHRTVDLLKLSIEAYEIEVLRHWSKKKQDIPVCQLLINFVDRESSQGEYTWREGVKLLRNLHFDLFSCDRAKGESSFRCGFFSLKLCPTAVTAYIDRQGA